MYPQVQELRDLGVWTQVAGLVTGLDYRDPDDSYDLLSGASRSFSITQTSARELGLRDDDLTIELQVPPIYSPSCYADTDWPGVSIARRNNVGIYGPADALAHDDWIGSGGVPTADASGNFVVTGAGALTLTIPSDYEGRLDKVALETAPEGPPLIYTTRKANHYYPAEPFNEGAYCWLGWEQVDIPITAPGTDTLTLTLVWREYGSIADNHLSDSTRTTTFSYSHAERTATFSVPVVAGAQTVSVMLLSPDPYPLYERVVSMALSGFDNGAWMIGEPLLVQSSVTAQTVLKTFEGYEYHEGGASAHLDAAYEGLYGSVEANAGSNNISEKTAQFFDRVTGAGSGLDLTTAYTLDSYASILQRVSEVFTASRYDVGYYVAVRDGETPPNVLSPCWGFDICYPNADAPDGNPLEQAITTTANCAIRCGTWNMVPGVKYRMLPDKIVEGRAHGNLLSGASLSRNQAGFSKLWRKSPVAGSVWEEVESLNSDAFGHWTSASLPEFYDYQGAVGRRWRYGIGPTIDSVERIGSAGYSYTREYITEVSAAVGVDTCCFHQIPGFVYVFYSDDGAKHIYNAPPDNWFETGVSQAHYALPKSDTTSDDSSFSGYTDTNGRVLFYLVRDGAMVRLRSTDWGRNFTEMATVIDADEAFVFPSPDKSTQHVIYVESGVLRFASSHDHFLSFYRPVVVEASVELNKPCGYFNGKDIFVYLVDAGTLRCWKSEDRGATWNEV